MGHYAAELQCDRCGYIRCACPLPVDRKLHWFVVDGFEVCTVEEFLFRYRSEASVRMRLAFMTRYEHRFDAEELARIECEEAVNAARANLTRLKRICKVERPWEAK